MRNIVYIAFLKRSRDSKEYLVVMIITRGVWSIWNSTFVLTPTVYPKRRSYPLHNCFRITDIFFPFYGNKRRFNKEVIRKKKIEVFIAHYLLHITYTP